MTGRVAAFTVMALLLLASSAQAGLIGVKEIIISSNANIEPWLQVSEVVALNGSTDLALVSAGATAASGSGLWYTDATPAGEPTYAIDGVGPASYQQGIYHSATQNLTETLIITLAAPSELDSITIFGRAPGTIGDYAYRDVYNLVLRDASGNQLFSATGLSANNASHSVTVPLTAPVPDATSTASLLLLGTGLLGVWRRLSAVR